MILFNEPLNLLIEVKTKTSIDNQQEVLGVRILFSNKTNITNAKVRPAQKPETGALATTLYRQEELAKT